jgi:hypothetical protein
MLWKEFNNGKASSVAPIADWTSMNRTDHFVQFYESDDFIINSVAEYFFHGLEGSGRCICVGTAEHNDQILSGLRAFGIDPNKAIESGKFIVRDAHELLSEFMSDGVPDARRFEDSVGNLVKENLQPSSPLRVFGEMVAVLCDQGNQNAAVRLEELWNALRNEYDFSLFCAYPLKGFAKPGLNGGMQEICCQHTKTIPAESYSSLTTPDERLRAIAYLQQRAEQLAAEIIELESRISNRAINA